MKITIDRSVVKKAMEALTHGCPPDCKDGMTDSGGAHPWGEPALIPCPNCESITALRAALAEPQEPQRKPLSKEEIRAIMRCLEWNEGSPSDLLFARAVEAAHGIK